ncbi:stabilizer of axonemal microtubules 2 isoform X2 [Desmodus rotundus]|uniref:stabilizer of axonemal microtubules 2 isoform X2 n=1 Tax=Desmodus rotundus TaxID=9430 RepID=UPI0023812BAF|nr:stabilizer of axonemal microtubules 2 isoform X2 [Desmodus rotundus]
MKTKCSRAPCACRGCIRSDYRPYEIVQQPRHVPEEYKPKHGQIDLGTTYKRDFNSYKVQPVAIVRPLERPQVKKGKLDTVPTYKDDYRAWGIQRSELSKPEQTYCPPTVKFGNSTTFQDDYVPQEMQPRQNFKPISAVKPPTAPFHGDTSHRLDYVPYQLESKSARPKEAYRPPNQPFEDLTTHRCAFQGLLGESANICRPTHTSVTQNAPFEGSTEFQDRFQPWEIPPPEVKKVPKYVPPPGAMQLHSTSQLDYVPYQVARVIPIRPVSHRRNNKCPFQGKSTMKEDFPAWENCRRGLIKQQQQIPHSSGKFDGLSTFRSHYVPHALIPTESCKPLNAPFQSSSPFNDLTTYSTEYAPKKQEVCPASYPCPPGYIYENTNSRGHRFFRRVTPTVKAAQPASPVCKKANSEDVRFPKAKINCLE